VSKSHERNPHLSRRKALLAGGAALAVAGATPLRFAHAAEFNLKLAHPFPEGHPSTIRAAEAAKAIDEQSSGRVQLRVFPNSQLGSQADTINQVRSGAIDITAQSVAVLATIAPSASVVGTAFAFPNYDTVWKAMDGELGAHIRNDFTNANLVAMDSFWDSGYRHITSSTRPIVTPDDLKGFKIRVPTSPAWVILFKSLGAAPTSLDLSELYSALQTKIVDGQENPIPTFATAKLHEVQKYCSMTGHIWDGTGVVANRRSWQKLPADMQAIVARNLNEAGLKQRKDLIEVTDTMKAELTTKGLIFNQPELAPFRKRLVDAGYYSEYKAKYKPETWALLTKYVGTI
jgi:tripartite ATP-independent transporter DctP family solute receptor